MALPMVAILSVGFAAPASAQAVPARAPGAVTTTDADVTPAIIVTGSRIARPDVDSPIPITSIAGERISQQGRNSIGDALNDLPQLSSSFSQQNPGAGVGIAGLNLLDLRGLGTSRTLVLVNGRRHVASDILSNGVSVDTNTIPSIMIERVDIVTGGNSAVYGSDAIAGVVNFVLKDHFDGIEVRANSGIADQGFGANQTISAIAGKNFGDGRGNLTISGEYSHASRVFASQIPWLRRVDGFVVVDNDTSGLPNGSDGFPDRIFFRDVRLAQTSPFGTVAINQTPNAATCGTGIAATNGAPSSIGTPPSANGNPYNCNYIFTADGRLTAQTGTYTSTGILPTIIGGNGATGREDRILSVLPFNQRYIFNAVGHYEFAPALDVFFEAKWGRSQSQGNASGPTSYFGQQTQFDVREKIRLDNPFLNPADRTTLAGLILASNCNTSFTAACANTTGSGATAITGNLTAAQRAQVAAGTYRFALGKQIFDMGVRDEFATRDVARGVIGLRGSFWDDWKYEIAANYGEMNETIDKSGYADKQRFVLSMDAGRNPATGQVQCRSQFDPTSATQYFPTTGAAATAIAAGRLAADIAACVPYNPFGDPGTNAAAIAYFQYFEHDTAKIDQLDLSGFVSGSTEKWFSLPYGPIKFALGGEYRKENNEYVQDEYAGNGLTNALAGLSFKVGPFEVKEAFGEIEIPILKDLPWTEELTINGAARVSDYNSSAGTVYTYNFGGVWAPTRDIRFRANYGRSVRAPNLQETSGSIVPNFANNFQDPCRTANISSGTQYRAANCAADLGALLSTPSFASQATYSLGVLSGFNPNLNAEKSNSLTIGAVITPRWLPRFILSVDYYDIAVNNIITSLTAQQIANGCYDLPTVDNQFCKQFTRFRGPGTGSFGEVPGQINFNTINQSPLNFAKRIRRGIDTQLTYKVPLGEGVSLSTNVIYTHVMKTSNYVNPQDPNFEDRLLGELGSPKDEFVADLDLTYHEFTLGYRMHYLPPMFVNAYEDFNALQDRAPQNADYADIQRYPAVFYHNLRFQWDLEDLGGFGKNAQFYFGADNVLNTKPPLSLTGIGAGSVIYDFRGRTYYAGFRVGI
ncbi:MAG: TonB-dependent receptor [Croceibacterium sp.]